MAKIDSAWIKTTAVGALGGAILIAIIALGTGWAVTGEAALVMAEDKEAAKEIALLTPICVAQFNMQAEELRATKLVAMDAESNWKQDDFVIAEGWATMPGSENPTTSIGDTCAAEIIKLAKG